MNLAVSVIAELGKREHESLVGRKLRLFLWTQLLR